MNRLEKKDLFIWGACVTCSDLASNALSPISVSADSCHTPAY